MTVFTQSCLTDATLTFLPLPGEGLMEIFGRLAAEVRESGSAIVHLTVFGPCGLHPAARQEMCRLFGVVDWPVTWVEGQACGRDGLAGVQALTFPAGHVNRIDLDGGIVGSVFESGGLRNCVLGGMGPLDGTAAPADQTRQTLERMGEAFALAGFDFEDTVRTWFYLDDILGWYGDFNLARTEIYAGLRFRTGSIPASTGVGGKNPAGAALCVGAWALQPTGGSGVAATEVASPLQCPAPAYGSSFSRAMEVRSEMGTRLFISGTASIAPEGQTLWVGDVARQVKLSMEVVEAILRSRGFAFSDVTRATAYFRQRDFGLVFDQWRAGCKEPLLELVQAQCDVCRDDLLFEFEADAWK